MGTLTGTRVELPDSDRFYDEESFTEELSERLKEAGLLVEHAYIYALEETRVEGEPMVKATAFSYSDDEQPVFFVPGFLPEFTE